MASRDHLVPTLTVDKNGRTTTVHKKNSSRVSTRLIPEVAMATSSTLRKNLIAGLASQLGMARSGEASERGIAKSLSSYSNEFLERLKSHLLSGEPFGLVQCAIVNKSEQALVNEYLCFHRSLSGATYYESDNLLRSLHQYEQLPECEDFSAESEQVIAKSAALLKVMVACMVTEDAEFRHESGAYVLDDDQLVELVLENSGKADQIANFIRERKSVDVSLVAKLISEDSIVLGKGML